MAVPYTFGTATSSIPLSQLDSNFNTVITLGNTAIQLGNTVTTLNNMTLANVTISSGNVTITNVAITTANVTTANITTAVIGTETVTTSTITSANITTANVTTANITTGNVTNGTVSTSLTLSYGTANGVTYLNGSKVLTSGSALTFDGTNFATTGTATAAKLIPTGSSATGNGLYLPAANSVGISTNGTNAVYIDSTQNVGIGTSSPAFPLDVGGPLANIRVAPSTATNNALTRYVNTGGTGYVGLDNSTGALTAAYALNLYHTGAYPIVFSTSGTERMRIDSTGNIRIGDSSGATNTLRYFDVYNTDTGASAGAIIRLITSNVAASGNTSADIVKYKNGGFAINNNETNAAAFTSFNVGASERMRIDSSGNVLVTSAAGLGYGTGSGGTVTQATSKSTAVTLNKPTGQITMNNAALGAGSSVSFNFINSLLAATDSLVIQPNYAANSQSYTARVTFCGAGGAYINVTNLSGGSLSEAVTLSFAIIKGATS